MNKPINTITVRDSIGRIFELKKATAKDKLNLISIIGEDAHNSAYMKLCLILLHIAKIDNKAIPAFKSLEDVEFLYELVGDYEFPMLVEAINQFYINMH